MVVLSGGVFQNELLLADLKPLLEAERFRIWTNHRGTAERWRHQPGPGRDCCI